MQKVVRILASPIRWFMRTRRRNRFIVLAILLVLFFMVRGATSSNSTSGYITEAAKQADIVEVVSETGNIGSAGRVDVFSTTTGVIEEIYIANDDLVEVDQNLFRVRSTATDSEKASAYANLVTARTALQTAQNNLRSAEASLDNVLDQVKGHDNDENFTQRQARTSAEVAKDNAYEAVKTAQANLNSAAIAYQATQNMTVKSPSRGMVANLSAQVGDKVTVASPLSTTAVAPVLVLTNPTDFSIRLAINEVDITKIKVGQKASVTLDAFDNQDFEALVTHIDSLGTSTSGVVTYTVVLELLNRTPAIRSGMTANVSIEVDRKDNVLSVPNNAVKPYQGGRAVRILENGQLTYIPVELGIKGDQRTEITKGITEGQEVIISLPNDQLQRPSLF